MKQDMAEKTGDTAEASPASNGGRGLKLVVRKAKNAGAMHRPPAMAGAD